jgi:tRNA threonylcarbamoyladenosine modification (KEOPS) complex  Pcc1 subunit
MYPVTGCIGVEGFDNKLLGALLEALEAEARNPPDPSRGEVRLEIHNNTLRICLSARDLSAARTLVNAYLSLVAVVLDAVAAAGGDNGSEASPRTGEQAS